MASLRKLVAAFGRFWWEFLIGENPDAFVAAIVIIGVALLLRHDRDAAIVVVPVLAVAALVGSSYRGRKREASTGEVSPASPRIDGEPL